MATFLLVALSLLALAAAAFCAGAETAFMSVGRGRVTHLAREGSRTAQGVQLALRRMNRTLTTLLIGNNLSHVVFSSAAAALGLKLFEPEGAAHVAWTILSAFTVLYLSEFLPKLFCSQRPLARSLGLIGTFRVVDTILRPLTALAMALTNLFVSKKTPVKEKVTPNEVLRILSDRKNGVKLSDFESALVRQIITTRARGEFVTTETLLLALDDED